MDLIKFTFKWQYFFSLSQLYRYIFKISLKWPSPHDSVHCCFVTCQSYQFNQPSSIPTDMWTPLKPLLISRAYFASIWCTASTKQSSIGNDSGALQALLWPIGFRHPSVPTRPMRICLSPSSTAHLSSSSRSRPRLNATMETRRPILDSLKHAGYR